MNKKVFITGITGQDGSYLAELLLKKGYKVYGLDRRVAIEDSKKRYSRIYHILDKITLYSGDLRDYARLFEIIKDIAPDECYHLGAMSFVATSFKDEYTILRTNIEGTINMLNIIRKIVPKCKFYFAGSSEQFGNVLEIPQTEKTPFNPSSPYGISKVAGFYFTKMYREAYNMFCCSGILMNHESPRRGLEFVTRKISDTVAKIALGQAKNLRLGNLEAKRDWGYTLDFVEAMWLMLQQNKPDDYVIATNETHSVKEFVEEAFKIIDVGLEWQGKGTEQKGIYTRTGEVLVKTSPEFYRPLDVNILRGDYSKAKSTLKWSPKTTFKELVKLMVEHDLDKNLYYNQK